MRIKRHRPKALTCALFAVLISAILSAWTPKASAQQLIVQFPPHFEYFIHDVGRFHLGVSNSNVSLGFMFSPDPPFFEFEMSYPKETAHVYPMPRLIVAGIKQGDTLVSTSTEFWAPSEQAQYEFGDTSYSFQTDAENVEGWSLPRAEQEFTVVYYDTLVDSPYVPRQFPTGFQHRPLNLRIKQTSMAWSYAHVEDVILFNYEITNIGNTPLEDVYVGVNFVGPAAPFRFGGGPDDISGFFGEHALPKALADGCEPVVDFNLAWGADNNGDPVGDFPNFGNNSPIGATGVMILSPNPKLFNFGYNWWRTPNDGTAIDFGPRQAGTPADPVRPFTIGIGSPFSDEDIYYVMASGEVDYGQLYTALNQQSDGWLPPPVDAPLIAGGFNNASNGSITSVGPFDIAPFQTIEFTTAYIGAENFHLSPTNGFNPYFPQRFESNLNYDELLTNATWARWTYDNPGVDTDGDGFYGETRKCTRDSVITRYRTLIDSSGPVVESLLVLDSLVGFFFEDTIWVGGDGVPDFRAAIPPLAPIVRYTPFEGKIVVQWNGLETETSADLVTNKIDFEGYRVYIGRENKPHSMVLGASYDKENYLQWHYVVDKRGRTVDYSHWAVLREPFSVEEARVRYGKGAFDWHPNDYGAANPFIFKDSLFFFVPQDWNNDNLSDTTAIHKRFPNAPPPHTRNLDSAFTEDTWWTDPRTGEEFFYEGGELTADGKYFKYYEYQFIFENLYPSEEYWVTVTSIDHGSPQSDLPALETNPTANAIRALAQDKVPQSLPNGLDVSVYPNPYRIDGNYREQHYEGLGQDHLNPDRVREVHFTGLPPKCEIGIYSLDGDLISSIDHDKAPDDPSSMHDSWNVITRNLQKPVSGIYYWVVETPDGQQQIGKLVLIM